MPKVTYTNKTQRQTKEYQKRQLRVQQYKTKIALLKQKNKVVEKKLRKTDREKVSLREMKTLKNKIHNGQNFINFLETKLSRNQNY